MEEEEDGDKSDDAKRSGEADDPKASAEVVSLAEAILKVPNQLAGQYLMHVSFAQKGLGR